VAGDFPRLLHVPTLGGCPLDGLPRCGAGDSEWLWEFSRLHEGIHDDPQRWVPLRVGDAGGTPIEEIGVVATQANVLSNASVSLLYLSTYFSDFTLVPAERVETAVQAFRAHGFIVNHRIQDGQAQQPQSLPYLVEEESTVE